MPNRREFFQCLGRTSAGLYMLAHGVGAFAQGGRKPIMVGGREVKTVDIHAHTVIPEVTSITDGTSINPGGFPDWYVLGPHRIAAMDERGIDVAALSINPYWYHAGRDEAAELIRAAISPNRERPYTLDVCPDLQSAVIRAAELAEAGDVILLSPGGTSFDEFRDFEERGERFREWVNTLL